MTSLSILSSFALFDWPSDSFMGGSMATCIWQSIVRRCLCSRSILRRFLGDDFRICVFSSFFGSTVDTYLRQSTVALSSEEYEKFGIFSGLDFRICSLSSFCLLRQWIHYASVYASVSSPAEHDKLGFLRETTSGLISVFSAIWFDSGYMSVSVCEAGFAGDIAPRAVFLRGFQALMRCIMSSMDQEQFVAPCK